MINIKIPGWLNGTEAKKLSDGLQAFWELLQRLLEYPLTILDSRTCPMPVVELYAWERKIERFPGEPDELFRTRVGNSLMNLKDSGEIAGLGNILRRFGISDFTIRERTPGFDWDTIFIEFTGNALTENQSLLEKIVQSYGRTCRRYAFSRLDRVDQAIRACGGQNEIMAGTASAKLDIRYKPGGKYSPTTGNTTQ